jgi:hypothetical protein
LEPMSGAPKCINCNISSMNGSEGDGAMPSMALVGTVLRLGITRRHIMLLKLALVVQHHPARGLAIHHSSREEECDRSMSFRWYYPDQVQR